MSPRQTVTPRGSIARTGLLVSWCVALAAVAATRPIFPPLAAQEGDEPPPRFSASDLLTPAIAKGPHHLVGEDVRTEGYFHQFAISSTFGSFEAVGRTELAVRIQEIAALAALDEVSHTEVFLTAAGQSIVRIGQGAAAVVTDPAGTAKGLGAGVKRLGVNLGRRTQRAVASTDDDTAKEGGSAASSAANSILGVTAATRRWARKVGVDPYTTNTILRKALEDIAKVDAAGSIATKVVVPVPAPVGTISSVGDVVWGKDPEEVRKINERGLRALTVPDDVAGTLFSSRWFTLTSQTRLIAALVTVNVKGVSDYVRTAAGAGSAREALFFVESAEMLKQWHAREPVIEILTDSRALVTSGAGGRARALLPLDWLSWTSATHTAIGEITARARRELRSTRFELVTTGRASDRARRELEKLGWVVASTEAAR
jgi:hypothetical protein